MLTRTPFRLPQTVSYRHSSRSLMILFAGVRTSAVRYSFLLVCHKPYFSHNLSAPGNRGRKGTCTTVPYPVPLAPLPVIDRCDTLKPGTVRVHYTGQCLNCRLLSISYHIHPAMPGCYTTSPWCTKKFVRTNFSDIREKNTCFYYHQYWYSCLVFLSGRL